MKFVFEFEAVLKQRRAAERQRRLALAAVERERAGAEQSLRALHERIREEKETLRAGLAKPGAVDLRGVRMQANASLHLVGLAQQAVLRLAGLHRRADAARIALVHAATQRKGVELLRERRYAAWLNEQKRRESAVLDELAVMNSARAGEAI